MVKCLKQKIPKAAIDKKSEIKLTVNGESEDYAILFDMDGVLVDVTSSYRKAIQETVRFFSGKRALLKDIQRLKEKGGYNNDWDLTEAILISRGKAVPKTEIVKRFQEFYRGREGKNGFIENEKWLLSTELLRNLKTKYALGIVTGRPREEAFFTLKKFSLEKFFDVVVAMEDYPPEKAKPDPFPIKLALEKIGKTKAFYIGDSVDDINAAKNARVHPIGCIPPGILQNRLKDSLIREGAEKVLDNINYIYQAIS